MEKRIGRHNGTMYISDGEPSDLTRAISTAYTVFTLDVKLEPHEKIRTVEIMMYAKRKKK